ncbi:MAG: serine/threonine-protein kinase [Deltaproteobacteria bacterium]|nr:serine/threonine-protein kinase [Deltaproteobacteria bacterium]
MSARRAEGERFADFLLLRGLGRGGMAEVFEAVRAPDAGPSLPGVPERFALKRMLPELQGDPEARAAFLTEADVAPMLRHPNLVRVYASGVHERCGWLLMELVEGWDLEALLEERPGYPWPPRLATYVLLQVLEGLEYLHGATGHSGTPLGLIHRDVTPSNVFVDREGRVKLADLGIALVSGLGEGVPDGRVKGKLRYLSPEQVVAGELGPTTDVFAAGAVLYELLAGRHAFDQVGDQEVMLAIRDGKVPKLTRVAPDLPGSIAEVVHRALHRNARKRYATAAAFRDALAAVCYAEDWDLMQDEAGELFEEWMG